MLSRGEQRKCNKKARVAPAEVPLEKSVLKALRLGDVRKALQLFNSAPIAPKTQETIDSLKSLHPESKSPVGPPTSPSQMLHFSQTNSLVRRYRPFLPARLLASSDTAPASYNSVLALASPSILSLLSLGV